VSDIDTALVDSLKVLDPDGRLEKPTYAVQQNYLHSIVGAEQERFPDSLSLSALAVLRLKG